VRRDTPLSEVELIAMDIETTRAWTRAAMQSSALALAPFSLQRIPAARKPFFIMWVKPIARLRTSPVTLHRNLPIGDQAGRDPGWTMLLGTLP